MIKIVSWADRRLTKKSWAKIWNLFPNEEICLIDIPTEYRKLQWAKMVARYYILRGKDFSIEINPTNKINEVEQFLKIGVKKFYFVWKGIQNGLFFSSLDTISYSINITERYPDVHIYIVYIPPYEKVNYLPDEDLLETSITFLSHSLDGTKNIKGVFRRVHPWFGNKRFKIIRKIEEIAKSFDNIEIENECGCLTILPNTNIYCCPYCERKKRKKEFGNADRDKFVVGTIDRGIFRNIICNWCDGKRGKTLHTPIGGE